jgi:hypothetical protein
MTGPEIAAARRATRTRAEELYRAWHSDKIPLPSVPVKAPVEQPTEDAMVIEPGQQSAKSGLTTCGWRDLRRMTNYAARVLADDDAYENEDMYDGRKSGAFPRAWSREGRAGKGALSLSSL